MKNTHDRSSWPKSHNPNAGARRRIDEGLSIMWFRLYEGGESVARIAHYYSVAESTVRTHLRRLIAIAKAEGYPGTDPSQRPTLDGSRLPHRDLIGASSVRARN